jgi:hypothetical protein
MFGRSRIPIENDAVSDKSSRCSLEGGFALHTSQHATTNLHIPYVQGLVRGLAGFSGRTCGGHTIARRARWEMGLAGVSIMAITMRCSLGHALQSGRSYEG